MNPDFYPAHPTNIYTCRVTTATKVHGGVYIYRERNVQVTPGITLKSYTFFKLLDLNRFNGKKNYLLMLIF